MKQALLLCVKKTAKILVLDFLGKKSPDENIFFIPLEEKHVNATGVFK